MVAERPEILVLIYFSKLNYIFFPFNRKYGEFIVVYVPTKVSSEEGKINFAKYFLHFVRCEKWENFAKKHVNYAKITRKFREKIWNFKICNICAKIH